MKDWTFEYRSFDLWLVCKKRPAWYCSLKCLVNRSWFMHWKMIVLFSLLIEIYHNADKMIADVTSIYLLCLFQSWRALSFTRVCLYSFRFIQSPKTPNKVQTTHFSFSRRQWRLVASIQAFLGLLCVPRTEYCTFFIAPIWLSLCLRLRSVSRVRASALLKVLCT